MNVEAKETGRESRLRRMLMKFAKFMASSGICTLLDLGLFYALQRWVVPRVWPDVTALPPLIDNVGVFCAAVAARVCSATVNFLLNRNFVFRIKGQKSAVLKYILLSTSIMLIDAMAVGRLTNLLSKNESPFMATVIKAAVDTVLFVVNFVLQKFWVFSQKKQTEEQCK